jgi:mannose-6-phosphate isomerase-like protein (cupin superfamily)
MRLEGYVEKGWGHEFIFATNDLYCGKVLKFNKDAKFSMHFHKDKDETWFVLSGTFKVIWIDTTNATEHEEILEINDVWRNKPLFPHQVICLEEGAIIEVSTPDSIADNYRVRKGDSQK